ncbi:unnamed protein product [Rangifer tarandus platyrhynchus]|uniref:Uncharacterized protein n=2 Tax=Rangifer tarandus platyrhynchus TaxID=3082113 RepID=A0ABN8YEG2_RANTA|nr:unnamed protein product [Rangifer tarandus platyrhynchus]CAI9698481.1 unnamed protein product [Rangifer tarandus platyrhynchus]
MNPESTPRHPAKPSPAEVETEQGVPELPERGCGAGGGSPIPAEGRAVTPADALWSGGRGKRVLACKLVAAEVGAVGVGLRVKAALAGAWAPPTRRRQLGRCLLRSPRVAGGAWRSRTTGGGPGNGRVRVASAAAPVCYCDSSYFLFGGLGERKKKKNSGWGQGGWGGGDRRERRPGGDSGGQRLSPV